MTIRYKCEECGAVLNIKDELAGTLGHCPRCKVEFKVPAPEDDESVLTDKKPVTAAGKPSAEGQKRPAGAGFSDDDIESILEASGPVKSGTDYGVPEGGFDDAMGESDDEPRSNRRKSRRADETADDEVDDSADEGDDDDADRRRKKKGKGSRNEEPAKGDSAESALIAKNLMGRGEQAAVREEKKGGRPFGGADGGRDEDKGEFSAKEVVRYFATKGWPALLGAVAFMGLCYWLSSAFFKGVDLPPLAPVSGTVTLDGKPLANASIQFLPVPEAGAKPNLFLATPVGFTDANGKYELLYLVVNEKRILGAPLGKHLVVIKAIDKQGVDLLPLRYTNTSKSVLKAEVVKGMPPLDFSLMSSEESSPK